MKVGYVMNKKECLQKLKKGAEIEVIFNKDNSITKVSIVNENGYMIGSIQERTFWSLKLLLNKNSTFRKHENSIKRTEFFNLIKGSEIL